MSIISHFWHSHPCYYHPISHHSIIYLSLRYTYTSTPLPVFVIHMCFHATPCVCYTHVFPRHSLCLFHVTLCLLHIMSYASTSLVVFIIHICFHVTLCLLHTLCHMLPCHSLCFDNFLCLVDLLGLLYVF